MDVDAQVIPAIGGGDAGGGMKEYENEEAEAAGKNAEAEPVSGQNAINAEPLVAFFGESLIRKIFSKDWHLRDNGIKELQDAILQERAFDRDREACFVNAVGAVRYTVQDKMASVAHKSICFFIELLRHFQDVELDGRLKSELQAFKDPIVSQLVQLLGDNVIKMRNVADDALLAVSMHPQFGVQ